MNDCEKCGSDFRVKVCAIAAPPDRDRLEAYLCYGCRQEETHEVLE